MRGDGVGVGAGQGLGEGVGWRWGMGQEMAVLEDQNLALDKVISLWTGKIPVSEVEVL